MDDVQAALRADGVHFGIGSSRRDGIAFVGSHQAAEQLSRKLRGIPGVIAYFKPPESI